MPLQFSAINKDSIEFLRHVVRLTNLTQNVYALKNTECSKIIERKHATKSFHVALSDFHLFIFISSPFCKWYKILKFLWYLLE